MGRIYMIATRNYIGNTFLITNCVFSLHHGLIASLMSARSRGCVGLFPAVNFL